MTNSKARLINVSNRLPVVVKPAAGRLRVERSSGGLATALDSAWQQQSGIWIGWPGISDGENVTALMDKASHRRPYMLRPVDLSEEEVAKFYSGFANEIIWPLFHDMPTRCNFDPDYWEIYQRVNRKFAKAVLDQVREDDFIWVHDYHLMLTAKYLREAGVKARIGFFLHIPFPCSDMFEKLPWREPLLKAMLELDVLGFQSDRDRGHFVTCAQALMPELKIEQRDSHTLLAVEGRTAFVGTFPISIDFNGFAKAAERPEIASRASKLRRDLLENTIVLGVDRLDYTKGIPERLKAFRILLRKYPEMRGRITLVQVVVPSREDIPRYKNLRSDLELLVSRINGEFTHEGWVPIHYMHRNLGRDELLAYYRSADIALITPLKDGMNLVAKEFCAAQADERGVLIVSEFAGAGPELRQGALVVNPNDLAEVAEAIRTASLMSTEEKRDRMRLLRGIIREHNVQRWARSFMEAADASNGNKSPQKRNGSAPVKATGTGSNEETPGIALVAAPNPSGAGLRFL
jgi:trehalose 6-phosphate synthase